MQFRKAFTLQCRFHDSTGHMNGNFVPEFDVDMPYELANAVSANFQTMDTRGFLVMQQEYSAGGRPHIQGYYEADSVVRCLEHVAQNAEDVGAANIRYCTKGKLPSMRMVVFASAGGAKEFNDAMVNSKSTRPIVMREIPAYAGIAESWFTQDDDVHVDDEITTPPVGDSESDDDSQSISGLSHHPPVQYAIERTESTDDEDGTIPRRKACAAQAWWLVVEPVASSTEFWSATRTDPFFEAYRAIPRTGVDGVVLDIYMVTVTKQRPSYPMLQFMTTDTDVRMASSITPTFARNKIAGLVTGQKESPETTIVRMVTAMHEAGESIAVSDIIAKHPSALKYVSQLERYLSLLAKGKRVYHTDADKLANIKWLCGPSGTGKSHAAKALARAYCDMKNYDYNTQCCVVSANDARYHTGMRGGSETERTQVLVLDEVLRSCPSNPASYTPAHLIALAARWRTNVVIKCGEMGGLIALDLIICTSNLTLEAAFEAQIRAGDPSFQALVSRMKSKDSIYHFDGVDLRGVLNEDVFIDVPFTFDATARQWVPDAKKPPRSEVLQVE